MLKPAVGRRQGANSFADQPAVVARAATRPYATRSLPRHDDRGGSRWRARDWLVQRWEERLVGQVLRCGVEADDWNPRRNLATFGARASRCPAQAWYLRIRWHHRPMMAR